MKPILKWTLIVFGALLLFCLASPILFAKTIAETELEADGFTAITIERKGPMTFGFEATDKSGRKCTGTLVRGYSSGERNSMCRAVATDSDLLKKGTQKLLASAKIEFGDIDCGDVKLEDTEAQCDVSPVDGQGTHITMRFAHEEGEWKLTGPTTVWHRDDLEADVRKKLVAKGNDIKSVDCGQGLLGADLDQKLTCTVTLADASEHDVLMTFGKTNYVWSSDLL